MQNMVTVLSVKDIEKAKTFYMDLFGFSVKYDFGINICFDSNSCLTARF